jgi:putative lipoprotein
MRKHRLFSIAVLAAFLTASIFITACGGLNDPQKSKPEEGNTTLPEKILETNVFPKAPEGTTYSGYTITWIDAKGNAHKKTVTMDDIKNGIVLTGGVKEGTKPKVTPLVKNADGTETEKPDATQEVNPSSSTDWKPYIQAGIAELEKEHPDFDAALAKFKDAYNAEQNNTTKAYYAAVQLATISIKPETVDFMRNKMGFATYPGTLNALVNLEWFKEETKTHTEIDNYTRSISIRCCESAPSEYGIYQRVNGHIADVKDNIKASLKLSDSGLIYEMGSFNDFLGKWTDPGYNELCTTIANTQPKDRKDYYSSYNDLPNKDKYLIVDDFDENGKYMVASGWLTNMSGANIAQKYNVQHNGDIDYIYQVVREVLFLYGTLSRTSTRSRLV